MKTFAAAALFALAAPLAFAQATPVGLWKTIDDETKTEKSLVRISESGGALTGRIEKLLAPDAKADAVCESFVWSQAMRITPRGRSAESMLRPVA